jgi:hypothetical protein
MPLPSLPGWGSAPEKTNERRKGSLHAFRKVKSRAAIAMRLGAHCLYHAKNYLGQFYRKMKWRLGAAEAITATAHKLARIVYHLLSTKEPYSESVLARCDQQANIRAEVRLRKQAASLGFQLARIPETNSQGRSLFFRSRLPSSSPQAVQICPVEFRPMCSFVLKRRAPRNDKN